MKPLPMPIRIAAGLVATALEEAQQLPRKLVELPVTAVSQALQVSMRVQQRVTELAIKGDRALSALRPVPETPTWARFDEDETPSRANGLTNRSPSTQPPTRVSSVRVLPEPVADAAASSEVPVPRSPHQSAPVAKGTSEVAVKPDATPVAVKPDTTPVATKGDSAEETAGGPPGLTEYEQWSLPQLRGRFRRLTREQLEQLLAWETAHRDRPPFITMLSNRIASVTER
jgi:hypothetical protein